jgi:hypothetical protein
VTPPATLSPEGSPQDLQAVSDAKGDTVVVWSDGSNVWESERPAGGTFTTGSKITTAPSESGQALNPTQAVGIDESGNIYVFFIANGGGAHVDVATKPVGDSTWTVTVVEPHPGGFSVPTVPMVGAVAPDGMAVAIWVFDTNGNFAEARWEYATKFGASWSAPKSLAANGSAFEGIGPAVAINSFGEAAFVFDNFSNLSTHIADASSLDEEGASWTAPAPISNGAQSISGHPVVGIDETGKATAAWSRNNGANNIVQFTSRTPGAAWPAAPASPGANDLSPSSSSAGEPAIAQQPGTALTGGPTTIAWASGNTINERTRSVGAGSFNASTAIPSTDTSPSNLSLIPVSDGSTIALWGGINAGSAHVVSGARRAPGGASFAALPDLPGTANAQPSGGADNQGNAGVAWVNSTSSPIVQATGLAVASPTISNVLFPAAGIAGTPFSYGATLSDRWVAPVGVWNFGDGTTGLLSGTKTYTSGGVFEPTLTASDPFGNAAVAKKSITVAGPVGGGGAVGGSNASAQKGVAPTITAVQQSASRWRAGSKLATFSRHKGQSKAPIGTTFTFSLNTQANVTFTFSQLVAGRRVHNKCVAQTKKNRRKQACKRETTAGTLTFVGHRGTDTLAFQGRISGSKKLKTGKYTVTIAAANAAGQSRSAPLAFTIVK